MKYKLQEDSTYKEGEVLKKFLKNRGIVDVDRYLAVGNHEIIPFENLENIEDAVRLLEYHIAKESIIGIVVDTDADGFASASILYKYLLEIYDEEKIRLFFHASKKHGLSEDISIPDNIGLLIVPDAGSNDVNESRRLKLRGIDVLILDHHEIEKQNRFALIVNPHLSPKYENKYLSGTGVVYKFLKALDEKFSENIADDFLDLVALSIISDSMSLKEYENKWLVDLGLSFVRNGFFEQLILKQNYSLKGVVDIIGVQFYIVPLINAMIRAGSMEDQEKMFKAFAGKMEYFPYKKRGADEEVQENIFEHVARLCVNVRNKQNREIEKAMDKLIPVIEEKGWDKNKVMFVNVGDQLDKNYTGLVAMKLASKYGKPCLLLRPNNDRSSYSGSGRNIECDIEDLKQTLSETGFFSWIMGHGNAFGVAIKKKDILPAIEHINEMLQDFDFSKTYLVDYVFEASDVTADMIFEMAQTKPFFGQGMDEMRIVINNLVVMPEDADVLGRSGNTFKVTINDVTYLKFGCEEEELDALTFTENGAIINIVCKPSINEFNGEENAQCYIEEIEFVNKE